MTLPSKADRAKSSKTHKMCFAQTTSITEATAYQKLSLRVKIFGFFNDNRQIDTEIPKKSVLSGPVSHHHASWNG
ncbi:hypothetical protein GCM10023333_15600 [Ferrimonas pelagia]|uniref:Uncharacterized protein n=1 Tax=Ferrimonas pelagia TaxID=1177826 RepID=A0ABP9EVW7_9GAMM